MTLLDYFAGQALAGMLANDSEGAPEYDASDAYIVAEAMLAERAKRQKAAEAERKQREAAAQSNG